MPNSLRKSSTIKVLALVASIFFVSGKTSVLAQVVPTESGPTLQLGIQLVKEKKVSEAVAVLKTVTAKNKQDAEAWYYLGFAYLQKPDFKKATSALQTATTLRPDFAPAFTALGYGLLHRGKLDEAKVMTERSLALQPVSADAHYILGVIHLRTGNREQALKLAELAIKENPALPDAYLLKSQSLVFFMSSALIRLEEEEKEERLARYREAAQALERYLKMIPDSANRSLWQDQLDSLRMYSQPSAHSDLFVGKQVTTKVRIISKPEPSYTSEARDQRVTGTVVLRTVFTADGQVKHILVVAGLPGGLTEKAINAARRIKFQPATKDGKPVSMWIQLEYNFNLY
jgi:TonB family protein